MSEFTCPECGSHKWGTALERIPGGLYGSFGKCHGYLPGLNGYAGMPCAFKWNREDDAKHLIRVMQMPDTGIRSGQIASRS